LLLRPNSYFTHQTALNLHGLIAQKPKTIYVKTEQSPKYRNDNELEQQNIDNAFRVEQRNSKSAVKYKGWEIRLLNGIYTGQLGVTRSQNPTGGELRYTNLERTLIDATVRPAYSGGVAAVLDAYKHARTTLSISRLMEYLGALDFKYPYHQAVGFYLEHTRKFRPEELLPLRKLGLNFDFYLAHGMNDTKFDEEWRIHYPSNLEL
jgi:hypothetical protein